MTSGNGATTMQVNGIEFFARYSRLRDSGRWPETGIGVCFSCGRNPVMLHGNRDTAEVCAACVLLRQTYPYPPKGERPGGNDGKGLRLSKGDHALITPSAAIYWARHRLRDVDPTIEVRPQGAWTDDRRRILHDPPSGEWMLIGFQRSPMGRDFFVNRSRDYVQASGALLLGKSGRLRCADLKWVRRTMAEFPAVTSAEWHTVLVGQCLLRVGNERVLKPYHKVIAAHPGLRDYPLPPLTSGESLALEEMTADVVDRAPV